MSTLHESEDGRNMLDLVDKLRNIDKIEKTIPLPQIVVVGQQSSGKSSVLKAISGIPFPVKDDLCTTFPTEIVLRREDTIRTTAFIRSSSDISELRKAELKAFESKWQNTQLSLLENVISDAKNVLHLNGRKRFCRDTLVLEICGPDQEHLTLIDLPGIIRSTREDQDSSDIPLVNEIANEFVSRERTIVLAVISGGNDFANQEILENLKHDEKLRQRTLGVVTAPDLIPSRSSREKECVKFIQADPRNLGYGWHILRNLSTEEVEAGILNRDEVERSFFSENDPWKGLNADRLGSHSLKNRLSLILKKKIAESLPQIQQEVDIKLEHAKVQLEALGEARESPGELRDYLCTRARMFGHETRVMLSGAPPMSVERATPSLRAFVQSKHQAFADEMFDKAQTWNLDTEDRDDPDRLRQIWRGEAPGTARLSGDTVAQVLYEEISEHRGKELQNLLHPDWASIIFRRQSKRWLDIARFHADTVFDELYDRVSHAVEKIAEGDTAENLLEHIVEPALQSRKKVLDAKLLELYHPYTQPSIFCVSRKYKEVLNNMTKPEGSYEYINCCNLLVSVEAFYKIAVDVFTENVVGLGVESCLLDDLSGILDPALFYKMSDDKLEMLAGERQETKQNRRRLQAEIEQFEEARDHILPAFNIQRSRNRRRVVASRRTLANESIAHTPEQSERHSAELTAATPPPETESRSSDRSSTPTFTKENRNANQGLATPAGVQSYETTPSSNRSGLSGGHTTSQSSVSSHDGLPFQFSSKTGPFLFQGTSPQGRAALLEQRKAQGVADDDDL